MADVMIPGLNASINSETLIASKSLHNKYPPDVNFPRVDVLSGGFRELCIIIAKYHLQSYLRLRLLHRHLTLDDGQILLGHETVSSPRRVWTQPTAIRDTTVHELRGHIFSVKPTGHASKGQKEQGFALMPSEFRYGPSSGVPINADFVAEFIDCLCRNQLDDAIGLETKEGEFEEMLEFSDDTGSLLVRKGDRDFHDQVEDRRTTLQTTGWLVAVENGCIRILSETRCVTYSDGHRKITVGSSN